LDLTNYMRHRGAGKALRGSESEILAGDDLNEILQLNSRRARSANLSQRYWQFRLEVWTLRGG